MGQVSLVCSLWQRPVQPEEVDSEQEEEFVCVEERSAESLQAMRGDQLICVGDFLRGGFAAKHELEGARQLCC